jgi:transcriptional regulator with XRE-family HTH domain
LGIGSRIRTERKAQGLTQEELARRAGVSLNIVNRLERGETTDPHYSTLVSITDALGMSISDLREEPVPLDEASETGQPEEVVRDPEEVVRDLAEVAQEVLPRIDELYEQERSHRAQLVASEGIPQTYIVRAESKIVDLFSDLHRDAAPQVLAEVGLYYRREVAERDLKIAGLEEAHARLKKENAQLKEENAELRSEAEREGVRR